MYVCMYVRTYVCLSVCLSVCLYVLPLKFGGRAFSSAADLKTLSGVFLIQGPNHEKEENGQTLMGKSTIN